MTQQQKRPKYLVFARFGRKPDSNWCILGQTDSLQEAAEIHEKAAGEGFEEILLLTEEYLPDDNDYEMPGEYDICW